MEHEAATPRLPVGRIDAVLQVDQLIEADGGRRRRVRPDTGRRHDAGRLAHAGAHGEVPVGDARNALGQALVDVRLQIDHRVLQQFEGHRHRLGTVLVGPDGLHTEGEVLRRDRLVLAHDLALLGGGIGGRVVDRVAAGRGQGGGHLAHTAKRRHCLDQLPRHVRGHQIATLGGHRGTHARLDAGRLAGHRLLLLVAQGVDAAAQPGHKDGLLLLQLVGCFVGRHPALVAAAFGGGMVLCVQVIGLLLARNLGIEPVDVGDQAVVLLLLDVLPLIARVLVDEVAQGLGMVGALFAQGLDAHGFSPEMQT